MVGSPKGSYIGVFFYLKWRWALNQEITDSAAQQGWCPRSAACNSWCIHHPAVCDGRMCTAGTGAGRADGPIWLKNSPKQGLRGLAALSSWCIHPHPPAATTIVLLLKAIKWGIITSFLFKYLSNAKLLVSYTKTRFLLIEKCILRHSVPRLLLRLPSYPSVSEPGSLMVIFNVLIEFLGPKNLYVDTKILARILKKISGILCFCGHLVRHFV